MQIRFSNDDATAYIMWNGPLTSSEIEAFAGGARTDIVNAAAVYMRRGRYRSGMKGRLEFVHGVNYYVAVPIGDIEVMRQDALAAIERADLARGPTSGTGMGQDARRLVLLDRGKDQLGSARALGEVLGVGRRNANHKLNADRRVSNFELKLVADAIEAKARDCTQLAADLRAVIA